MTKAHEKSQSIRNKKVLIIGGGIAGLGAAAELLRHDCEVKLLEAKARLGGRIHTLSDSGSPIELGAEFMHGQSMALRVAIEAAGLSAQEISLKNEFFEAGKFRRKDIWKQMSKIIHRIDPSQPDCSMETFLMNETINKELRQQITSFINGFHAAPASKISAHSLRRAEYAAEHMESMAQSRLDAGYSALIDFLAEDVRSHGGVISTNTQVKKIKWQTEAVEVEFLQSGQMQIVHADRAIVTVPLGVLKSGAIEFMPPLTKKLEAINQLQVGNVVKIVLSFQEKCWPDFDFIQAPDERLPTWWTDSRGPVLTGWAGGPQADSLESLTHPQLKSLALSILEKLFPESAGKLKDNFISSHYHDWAKDPHACGAYSYIPVQGLDLPKLLAAPVDDTLFFAGEATVFDAQTGLVSEAYETGLRAARELAGWIKD
jgi:monoamine oxidase